MIERVSTWISAAEYLDGEDRALEKSEYFDGESFAMAGGTEEHNLIAANVARQLGNQLDESPCRVYPSDQRVKIGETGLYTYPDVVVVCDPPRFEDSRRRTLLNPTVLVEVLSQSTESYDRGDKFAHYRRLQSLREYVLVSSDHPSIERFTRQATADEWLLAECTDPAGEITLPSIGCTLSLAAVYRKVEFPEREAGKRRGPLG